MKKVWEKIDFYNCLYGIISYANFYTSSAQDVVKMYEGIKGSITWKVDFSMEFLQRLHEICNNENKKEVDYDILEDLVKSAFRDLAKHLRDPTARNVVNYLINISGCDSDTILFVQKTNVRELADGYAVVTLVVSSSEGLDQLLSLNEMPRNPIEEVYLDERIFTR